MSLTYAFAVLNKMAEEEKKSVFSRELTWINMDNINLSALIRD